MSLFTNQDRKTLFAEIILPVPLEGTFTYRIPHDLNEFAQVGARVVVQFGTRRKVQTGVIYSLTESPPKAFKAKYILEILDHVPVVNKIQFKIWYWVADYYMCTVGEVMAAGIPNGLKLSSQSQIQLNPDFAYQMDEHTLDTQEKIIIDSLRVCQTLTFDDVADLLKHKNIYHVINQLIKKESIIIFEQVKHKYTPKVVKKVRLDTKYAQGDALKVLLESLKKRPKQENVLLQYLVENPIKSSKIQHELGVLKSKILVEGISKSSYNTLKKQGILEEFEQIIPRFEVLEDEPVQEIKLSDYQAKVSDQILREYHDFNTVLLHGITGSGKTEIYIDIIQKVLDSGSQVLFLLPEIALTTQIVVRLKRVFGSRLGVYHSKFSDNERVEIWQGILDGKFQIVVGVRSAVWLPFSDLGLIVVDEEHDASYKQYDPAPRYNARDLALVLANFHGSKVLLGSATPSVESYYLASQNRYGLVEANQRYGNAQLPHIELVNTRVEKQQKTMQGYFSSHLLNKIEQQLEVENQVILFQNRRGYAPQVDCSVCGWTPGCNSCSISLTYHQYTNQMRCHYCGHHEAPPQVCPVCGSVDLITKGFGTQHIEEDLKQKFPHVRVGRMDLDTTRKKNSYQNIIHDFATQKTNILVGTQMVTKGLDFDCVGLVGVFDSDRMLHFPDFRSHERTFQILVQVSGRAGRRNQEGLVLIQTGNPQHQVLQKVKHHNYYAFYKTEIEEREKYHYPPFTRLIRLLVKNIDLQIVETASLDLAQKLQTQLGEARVLGPESPPINRIRNQYLKIVTLKLERNRIHLQKVKQLIHQSIHEVKINKRYKRLIISIDVDPM